VNCQLILTRSRFILLFQAVDFTSKGIQIGNSALAETLAGKEADLDFRLIQPTTVFRSVMHRETIPYLASVVETKVIGECLAAVNVQVVHHQVNGLRGRIALHDRLDSIGEFRP
jgi:hypothetical protein